MLVMDGYGGMKNPRPRSDGYTMVELMIVLVVAVILLAIGVPAFRDFMQTQKIATTANSLFSAINLARSEAIQRGTRVDLVPANGMDWNSGWIVLVDQNGNQKADGDEQIIFSHGLVSKDIQITSAFTDSKKPYLAYNGTGRTRTNANSQTPQMGAWLLTLDNHSRRVVINFLGRPRVCNPKSDAVTC